MPTTSRQILHAGMQITDEKHVSTTASACAELSDGRILGLSERYRAVATGSKTEPGLEVAKAGQCFVSSLNRWSQC